MQGEEAVGKELREGGKGRSCRMSLTSTPNKRETPDVLSRGVTEMI